ENTHQQNDREHEDGDGDERRPEVIGLRDEGERDHRTRQDRQEHVDSPERLGVRQRTRRKQAPVLGGEDLELGSDPWLRDWRNLSRHVVLLNPRQVNETTLAGELFSTRPFSPLGARRTLERGTPRNQLLYILLTRRQELYACLVRRQFNKSAPVNGAEKAKEVGLVRRSEERRVGK